MEDAVTDRRSFIKWRNN